MVPSPCAWHRACPGWSLHLYFRMVVVLVFPLPSRGWFCGRPWPPLQPRPRGSGWWGWELQWYSLACREPPPPGIKQRTGPTHCRFKNQPPGLAPDLSDVGLSWHWVVDIVNGEDDVWQGLPGITWDHVLLEKEGEWLVQLIFPVKSPRVTLWPDTSPPSQRAWH